MRGGWAPSGHDSLEGVENINAARAGGEAGLVKLDLTARGPRVCEEVRLHEVRVPRTIEGVKI